MLFTVCSQTCYDKLRPRPSYYHTSRKLRPWYYLQSRHWRPCYYIKSRPVRPCYDTKSRPVRPCYDNKSRPWRPCYYSQSRQWRPRYYLLSSKIRQVTTSTSLSVVLTRDIFLHARTMQKNITSLRQHSPTMMVSAAPSEIKSPHKNRRRYKTSDAACFKYTTKATLVQHDRLDSSYFLRSPHTTTMPILLHFWHGTTWWEFDLFAVGKLI